MFTPEAAATCGRARTKDLTKLVSPAATSRIDQQSETRGMTASGRASRRSEEAIAGAHSSSMVATMRSINLSTFSIADVQVFALLHNCFAAALPDVLALFPRLRAFRDRVAERPGMKAYLQSERYANIDKFHPLARPEAEAVVEEQQEAEAVGVPRSAGARQGEPIWPSTNPVVGSQAAWDRRWMRPSISSASLLMFSGSQE